ncbi:MAG: myo-inosose-2 dehydratase [Gammaproteobacteria bacterium]|nr:myo-inosose-2 dehydratase [Gammaproteobacteria bacterium]MBV8405258.1 myo-inosose-2 dehydratase [Gammaproteobacteria bacterium]
MSIRFGANPIIWSNDDLRELGGDIPLETCLAQARQIGFEGMELGHKFPRTAPELAAVLGRFGLACVSGWYSAQLRVRDAAAELEQLRPHLELLKSVGSPVLVFAEVSGAVHGDAARPLSGRPRLAAGEWRELGRRVTEVAAASAAEGVALVFHHHMGTLVQSEAEIDALMEATGDEVGLLLDTGHARFAGADPVALARRYAARIRHVHAKDVRAEVAARAVREDWSFLHAVVEGVFTVPGDGCVPFDRVFDELRRYQGWIVLEAEQDPKQADPLTYATLGLRNLRQLVAERIP